MAENSFLSAGRSNKDTFDRGVTSTMIHRLLNTLLLLAFGVCVPYEASSGQEKMNNNSPDLSRIQVPYSGEGRLVTLWSSGPDRPTKPTAVHITSAEKSSHFELEGVSHVRWLTSGDLIIQQSFRNLSSNGYETRLVQVGQNGEILNILSSGEHVSDPEQSKANQLIAVMRTNIKGNRSLEIRKLNKDFDLLKTFEGTREHNFLLSNAIWSPDGTRLATGFYKTGDKGRLWPLLATISLDDFSVEYPLGDTIKEQGESRGVHPLFWLVDDIFSISERGLLKCSQKDKDCKLIYQPGKHRAINAGTTIPNGKVLLLVSDLKLDPFEVRAKEIHKVDLDNSVGRILMRTPDGVFVSSIDWRQIDPYGQDQTNK